MPANPVLTLAITIRLLDVSKPTALKALAALEKIGVLHESTGLRRDRSYAYKRYVDALSSV